MNKEIKNNNITNTKVTQYIRDLYRPWEKEEIKRIREYGVENNIPIIQEEVVEFLKTLLKIYQPKRILEIGTAIGYSSIIMAESLSKDVEIISLEISKDMVEIAEKNIRKLNYKNIKIIQGDALETIEGLNGQFDFVFIDAAKGQYLNFFDKIFPLLSEKAVILSDNILYKGMIADDSLVVRRQKTIVRRIRKYLIMLTSTKGLTTSVLPLGDGVALTFKEE